MWKRLQSIPPGGAARCLYPPPPSRVTARGLLALGLLASLAFAPRATVAQDYGSTSGWGLVLDVGDASGLVVGVRHYLVRYGYRRVTWSTRLQTRVMASVRGGVGADMVVLRQLAPGGVVLSLEGGASRRLRSYRYYGLGNDRPPVDPERALVPLDEVSLGWVASIPLGSAGTLELGPALRYVRPHPDERGPLAREGRLGAEPFAQLGVTSRLDLARLDDPTFPREGIRLLAGASAHPAALDARDPFGAADLELRGYLPLPAGAVLAGRAKVAAALGAFPAHEAVFLGGSETLRGHRRQRFAGDRALMGSAELRVPLFGVPFLEDARLGALGFADAGRVFVHGESPGGWHAARGVGAWYESRALTVAGVYAWGEDGSAHLYLGLPF